MSDDPQATLLASQLRHALDLIKADLDSVKTAQSYSQRLTDHRLTQLEDCVKDHETRIRSATDGVTRFNTWSSLLSGSSFITSIAAFIKAFLSP